MFLPRKSKIFDRMVEQSLQLQEAASAFLAMVDSWSNIEADAKRIKEIEERADKLVHALTDDIEKHFILPLDKEDIRELAEGLDDTIDFIEEVANRISIYHLPKPDSALHSFAELIVDAAKEIHQGITLIRDHQWKSREIERCHHKLHALESKGDDIHRKILGELMGDGAESATDVMRIMKWKEVYQGLENTLDCAEDMAILFERLHLKYR